MTALRIGTRGSQLALAQARATQAALQLAHPGLEVELTIIQTKGDLILDRALSKIGDKGLFVTEIEQALQGGAIDLAVHSAKDLPSALPADLVLAAFPARATPWDALIRHDGAAAGLASLPAGAQIGTSSLRRACQVRALRPDCQVLDLRGNVDTRLRKLQAGDYDAIILAAAGLERLGLDAAISYVFPADELLPAVAQGALALQCRAADDSTRQLLAALDDAATRAAVTAERALLGHLQGGCQVPIAGFAQIVGAELQVRGLIGRPDGTATVRAAAAGPVADAAALGVRVAASLLAQGGAEILRQISASAAPAEAR